MSFLCDKKVAKYVTKMAKYVIFQGYKALNKVIVDHFYCQYFSET